MEGESGTVVIRLRAAVLHCQSQGDGPRVARFVCPAIWRMLVWSFVREAEAAPSCGALHPLRPLGGPRVARIVCHAIWRMLVWSLVREAEAVPSCGALHPLRPLGGPRVARFVCPATHNREWRMLVRGFRAGSGSSALLRCPASASALERASHCTNRLSCDT